MALDPHVKRLLGMVAASASTEPRAATIEERRRDFAKLMAFWGSGVAGTRVEDRELPWPDRPATPIRIYTPAETASQNLPGLVFFHGGGLVAGSLDTHDAFCRSLAEEGRCRLVAIDYRLAPEHKYPSGLTDCCAAVTWVMEHAAAVGVEGRVAIAGDSAGATLAAVTCLNLAQIGEVQPLFQLLLCPIADFAADTESRRLFGQGHLIDTDMMAADLAHYLPADVPATDPRVSPLRAVDLRGLCPAYIHTAEADPLRDEGAAYAARLREAGVEVHYTCHPGMIHLFYGMAGVVPYARTALKQIGTQIRAAFADAASPAADRNRLQHG